MSHKPSIRLAFVLPGLHRVARGAETAFEALAAELAQFPDITVTLIGSGEPKKETPYSFIHAPCPPREQFQNRPALPLFRNEYRYEEFSFMRGLRRVYAPENYDATITCSYPFVQWFLRTKKCKGKRPKQIFVTQNGDWPAQRKNMEYRFFGCDGLVCTNPEYFKRHKNNYRCALIPNGINTETFSPGPDQRNALNLPNGSPLYLMVSALIDSKYPIEGIRAVARIPSAALVVAGDGPLRETCDALGKELLGERYQRIMLPPDQMPDLYRSADALLHMSRSEAFGNIYVEAAACALPVVAHATENTQWILGDTAQLIDTQNEEALHRALLAAPNQKQRPLNERFAWPTIAQQYRNFISQCLKDEGADNG